MKPVDQIDFAKLKEAVKALNALSLNNNPIVPAPLKTIGIGKEALAKQFGDVIDGLSDDAAAILTQDIADVYEDIFSDETAPADPPAAAEKAPKAEKAAKAPKAEKAPKDPAAPKKEAARGVFGSIVGSAADGIDTLVAAGTDIENIMAKAGVTRSRAVSHIKFLESQRGVVMTWDADKKVVKGTMPAKK